MKIALVCEWLDAWRGGAETSTLQFIHHAVGAGVEIDVFTRSRPASAPGLTVHTVSGAAMTRTRQSVTFAHRVDRILRTRRYELIHAITPCRSADIYQPRGGTVAETIERNIVLRGGAAARTLKRCTNVLNLKLRYMLALERELLGPPEGPIVIAISDYVVRQLRGHYQMADTRIRKIFNGVDPDSATAQVRTEHRAAIRREFGVADHHILVLQVAHNFRLKGVGQWLEALARLKREGEGRVRSLVLGKGDSSYWHRRARRLGITDRLDFVGPSNRVAEFYHAADLLVHPTFYDPCSRVVLEALSSGLPIVTTRWDGAAEAVTDGVNGFVLAESGDLTSLVDRVKALCDDAVRRKMGEAARAGGRPIGMAHHASRVLQLYHEVAADRVFSPACG